MLMRFIFATSVSKSGLCGRLPNMFITVFYGRTRVGTRRGSSRAHQALLERG